MRKIRMIAAAGIAAAAVLAVAAPAQATAPQCQNETGDVDILDVAGVDYPGSNGYVVVCHPGGTNETWSGVRVYSGPSGTCVAVIVAGTQYGCTAQVPV